ncbi:hypothetical protein IMCC9480_3191 [Oxalobacteraceae bacterium IMCC9480]|nr:hypothetical protein IMCC9480_3191 [Oxalobacteraceae bacterium IMCC9480]
MIKPFAATPSSVRVAATVVPPLLDELLLPPPPQATNVIANEQATAIFVNFITSPLEKFFLRKVIWNL